MKKIIDLTMTIHNKIITYDAPWHPKVEIKQLANFKNHNRETRKISLGTHTGTHIDSPRHFIENGKTVENINLEQLCGMATILDFSEAPLKKKITLEDIKKKTWQFKIRKKDNI